MTRTYLACKKNTNVFKNNEKALLFLLNCSNEQKEILLIRFEFERVLKSCISYFGEENILWNDHQIILVNPLFKTKAILQVRDFTLEFENEDDLSFETYLLRAHCSWCVFQNELFLTWKSSSQKK